jgi:hypothetical protein
LILRGEDTPQTRAVLAGEAERLKAFVNLLPEEDQYEAAMALQARNPRWIDIDKQLIAKAKTTSVFLDPARELLVGDVAAVFHNEINQLLKRAVSGQQLGQAEADLVTHLSALKALTTTEYDAVLTELARESVYQLKDTASGTLRRVSSKLNSMQGAVAQVSFFRSRQFRQFLGDRLNELRGQVREALGSGWTTTAVAEGRIYIAKRLQSGYSLTEFVDGAVVGQENRRAGPVESRLRRLQRASEGGAARDGVVPEHAGRCPTDAGVRQLRRDPVHSVGKAIYAAAARPAPHFHHPAAHVDCRARRQVAQRPEPSCCGGQDSESQGSADARRLPLAGASSSSRRLTRS